MAEIVQFEAEGGGQALIESDNTVEGYMDVTPVAASRTRFPEGGAW